MSEAVPYNSVGEEELSLYNDSLQVSDDANLRCEFEASLLGYLEDQSLMLTIRLLVSEFFACTLSEVSDNNEYRNGMYLLDLKCPSCKSELLMDRDHWLICPNCEFVITSYRSSINYLKKYNPQPGEIIEFRKLDPISSFSKNWGYLVYSDRIRRAYWKFKKEWGDPNKNYFVV